MQTVPMVNIWIRQTLDWSDAALVEAKILPEFRAKLHAWNATLSMPYNVFRARLKAIAARTIAAVDGAVSVPLESTPEGSIIIPMDDDDWLAPHAASALLTRYSPELRGYHWEPEVIEPPRLLWRWLWRLGYRVRPRRNLTCFTNNYALVKSGDLSPTLLTNHMRASAFFESHPRMMRHVPQAMSIQNRNLASQTALGMSRPSITRAELAEKLERFSEIYARWRLPGYLRWAQPSVDEMAALMSELRVVRGPR